MPSLDTNVLVRWLVEDDRKQTARVQTLFESARKGQFVLFVPSTVTLELEWVLRSRYQFEKSTVLTAFNALLEAQEIEFQDEAALERALDQYRSGAAEFADCLHAGLSRAADRAPLLTFDAKAARLANVEMLDA
jgi:predicted nucleic-acid-binding protein